MSAGAGFAGLQIAGALFSGLTQHSQYNAQASALDENARLTELQGEQQITATRHDERQSEGEAIAAMGDSGMVVGTGTAADILTQSALNREIEIGNIRGQAMGKAQDLQRQAQAARASGSAALIGGVLQAGAAGLSYAAGQSRQNKLDAQAALVRADKTSITPYTGAPIGAYTGSPFINTPLIQRRRLAVLPGPSF